MKECAVDFIDVDGLKLPPMHWVEQQFDMPPPVDASAEIDRQWERVKNGIPLSPGQEIAVGLGSRGIADLVTVMRKVVSKLGQAGYLPFITPTMGSHGGATAEGQTAVPWALDPLKLL